MIKVGITGGIGSGKSFVCKIIKDMGYPVYSCDYEAKRLMNESRAIHEELTKLIGTDAYIHDGTKGTVTLNKPAVAKFVFANASNAEQINGIVHPAVKTDFGEWAKAQTSRIVFQESAILFESGFNDTVDKTIEIYAPLNIRIERAMKRDNASEEQIMSRIAMQMDEEEKKLLADFCIINDGKDNLVSQIDAVINTILKSGR